MRRTTPIAQRLLQHLDFSGDCWIWTGAKSNGGYGVINRGRRRGPVFAHRVTWEQDNGPVPEGMDLDHLCRTRACCNPEHLEPVTRAENVARGDYAAGKPRGFRCEHPQTPQNTVTTPRGTVTCRTCKNAASRRYRARKKAQA